MKIKYVTKNQRLNVEMDSDSMKEAFKKLAEFQEVFDEECCQLCQNDDLQFVVRTVDNNDYYELKCKNCFAKLAFGQHKSGATLFPKRKNAEGSYDENKGWHKWNHKQNNKMGLSEKMSAGRMSLGVGERTQRGDKNVPITN